MTYEVTHYMPSLGTDSAGCSTSKDTVNEVLDEVRHSLQYLRSGERIIIELEEGDDN